MKKQLFFLFLFGLSFSYGQTLIYEQDFNGATIPNQWFLQNEGNGVQEWEFGSGVLPGSVTNFTGNAAIFNDDDAGDTGNHDVALLCFPYNVGELDLSPYAGMHIEMEYEYGLSVTGAGEETLEFLVYDDSTGDWIIVKTYDDSIDPTLEKIDISQLMVDHPGIDETNFYFAFRYDDIDSGWAYGAGIDNVKFTAYTPPSNNICDNAVSLNVGHDFSHYAIESTLEHTTASTGEDFRNAWFSFEVPVTGKVTIETDYAPGSVMHDTFMIVYSGSCGSLTYIELDDDSGNGDFAKIVLTGLTPGEELIVQVQDDIDNTDPLDTFLISVYNIDLSVEDSLIEGFSMYPNPVENLLDLDAENTINKVSVYNLLGEKLLEYTPKSTKTRIDVSTLSTGTYVLKIYTDTQIGAYKIIKD